MMRRGPGYRAPMPAPRGPMPPMPPPPPPHANQVSNVTNSNDFASKDSRVFVGNLNTFALTKEDVDRIFCQYGMVTGISMHKGYAFVQYNYPGEARRAVAFENGNPYGGQIFDLNIVSEPKKAAPPKRLSGPGQNDRRSAPMCLERRSLTGSLDDLKRPPPQVSPSLSQPLKRPRQDSNPSMQRSNLVTLSNSIEGPMGVRPRPSSTLNTSASRAAAAAVKRATTTMTKSATTTKQSTVSTGPTVAPGKDVLICGVCKLQFTSLHSLAQHKKIPCKLRTSCQCQTNPPKPPAEEKELDCATCDAKFDSAWALCQHCHKEHNMKIFKTADSDSNTNGASAASKAGSKDSVEEKNDQEANAGAKKLKTDNTSPVKK